MLRHWLFCAFTIVFGILSAQVRAESGVLLPHLTDSEGNSISIIQPSISATGTPGQFNITYVQSDNYQTPGYSGYSGNLYAATVQVNSPTDWQMVGEPVMLNESGSPVLAGYGDSSGGTSWLGNPWSSPFGGFRRPQLSGNTVVWTEYNTGGVHYYTFSDQPGDPTSQGIVPVGGLGGNANVSQGTIVSTAMQGPYNSVLSIYNPDGGGMIWVNDNKLSSASSLVRSRYAWAPRAADIVATSETTGRVAFNMWVSPNLLATCWSDYDLSTGTYTTPKPVYGYYGGSNIGIAPTNLLMDGDYLVLQSALYLGSYSKYRYYTRQMIPQPTIIMKWDPIADTYMFLTTLAPSTGELSMTQPSLFGSYLVYGIDGGSRIEMTNLETGEVWTIAEDLSGFLDWPAVWVDKDTGQYVVLYQSSHSPDDLMIATTFVPEPATVGLLAVSGMFLVRRRKRASAPTQAAI
ncbi:MAG: PEP-CTERM sorting domain-containing protein [Planctomycetaceae bacterium]|nr:PEP-CTERM sorting domain-containing protein [Planctomycetaceae bacterium]